MRIWKFPLEIVFEQEVELPKGAVILTAQARSDNTLSLWAICDQSAIPSPRTIMLVTTGDTPPEGPALYISTVQLQRTVYHVFQIMDPILE